MWLQWVRSFSICDTSTCKRPFRVQKENDFKTTENQHSYQPVCPQAAKHLKQYDPNSHQGKQDRLRLASVEEGTHIHDPRSWYAEVKAKTTFLVLRDNIDINPISQQLPIPEISVNKYRVYQKPVHFKVQ